MAGESPTPDLASTATANAPRPLGIFAPPSMANHHATPGISQGASNCRSRIAWPCGAFTVSKRAVGESIRLYEKGGNATDAITEQIDLSRMIGYGAIHSPRIEDRVAKQAETVQLQQ